MVGVGGAPEGGEGGGVCMGEVSGEDTGEGVCVCVCVQENGVQMREMLVNNPYCA